VAEKWLAGIFLDLLMLYPVIEAGSLSGKINIP